MLHEDFCPYKMVMVQAMNDQDIVNRKTVCEILFSHHAAKSDPELPETLVEMC
jgi:hypothetical protein